LQLQTNGTAALTVDTSANVGVGTASPSFPLDVAGAIRGNSWIGRANTSAPTADAFIYRPADGTLGFGTGSTERMRIDSSGNVGIGTSSPTNKLHVSSSGFETIKLQGTSTVSGINFVNSASSNGYIYYDNGPNMLFYTNGSERARITSAGVLQINQGSGVYIGGATAETIFRPGANGAGMHFSTNALLPASNVGAANDNAINLGSGSNRYATVFAATGSINTSDAREKTSVRALTITEIRVAKQFALEIGSYKWLAAIEAKGDAAREHIGLTVQRAIEIMEANGLVPFNYGFICYDEFEDGNRYAFRMDELSLFIARGQQSALQEQQALITQLQADVALLKGATA
jgi:hypothetical protein